MVNGRIDVAFEFESVDKQSVLEIIFGYDEATHSYFTAGVGGGYGMFSVRQWLARRAQRVGAIRRWLVAEH